MEKETSAQKPWTKTWWGILIAIIFLPITLIYLVWNKTEWKSYIKGLATAGILFFTVVAASNGGQAPLANTSQSTTTPSNQEQQVVTEEKEDKVSEIVPFETQTKDDSTLARGTTKVQQEGVSGTKVKTFKVTYIDGKEASRVLASEVVTVQPVSKIVLNGTYVYVAPTTSTGDGYTNSAGDYVQSPTYAPSAPAGATAKCGDGTYSFSQSRSGTCSHHGGVAQWL